MTNKFLLNLLGFNPDLTSRQSRVDSVSILSRQSDLLTYLGRIAAILLLVLTIGSGNVWGAEEVYKETIFNSTNNSGKAGSYSNSWYNTTNSFRVNITNANNNNNGWEYVKIGSKSSALTGTFITNAIIDQKITKVSINIGAITTASVTSIKLYTSTNKSSWTERGTFTKATGWKDVTIAAANQANNYYYKIEAVCAKASSNGPLQINGIRFYKEAGGTTYTVTYNKNNASASGTMTDSNSPYASEATVTVLANGFTAPSGKVFSHWDTKADDSGTDYAPGATFSISGNTTLYAQWATAYTVTYNLNGGTGTTPTESAKASGSTFTLHDGTTGITPPTKKVFSKWRDQDGTDYEGGDTYTMPSKNVTLTAQWVTGGGDYVLVEDAEDIGPGKYLIVYNNTYALNTHYGNVNANTYGTYTDISDYYNSKKIASNATTDALAYTVAETTNGYSIKRGEYLGCTTATNTGLRWDETFEASTDEWTLGVDEVRSVAQTGRYIRWNNTSGSYRFATYTSGSCQSIQLFKQVEACEELGTINGSVSWSGGNATVSWDAAGGCDSWGLKYKRHADSDIPANWTSYAGSFGTADSRTSNSTAISGLDAGVNYDFKITGTSDGSVYCSGTVTETKSSTVPKITASSSMTDLGYQEGETPVAQTFTITGTQLTGNLTVTAPSNFLVSLDGSSWSAAGGSKTVTVSTPPSNLGTTTIYVKAASGLSEGDNPSGNVTISGGGAASVNVAIEATITEACTAPSSVTITGTTKYFGGQTISLTATPSGGAGEASYQWQKKVSGVWTNVANGGGISGATTNNLQISSCTHSNSGGYRCVVSTGTTCSTKSHADDNAGYGVHVYSIYGRYYNEGEWAHNEIAYTSGTTGTATVHLSAKKTYTFKVRSNNDLYYGNSSGNFIIQPATNMDCGTNNSEIRLFTTIEGDYTITVDIAHGLDNSPYVTIAVSYPSVTHPSTGYVYVQKFSWRPYLHYWYDNSNKLTEWGSDPQLNSDQYTTICGTEYWCVPVIDYYCNFIAKDAAGDPSNTTGDQHTNSPHPGQKLYNDGSWKWAAIPTYTISYAGGTGSTGSMSSESSIIAGSDQTLTAFNTITKAGYTFSCWHANQDVTIGGSTVNEGDDISDGATIQNVCGNITLTAQWTANTNTAYTVKHYQQNIADNNYTEVTGDRQNLTGTTDASVTPAVKSYTGFTAPSTQTVTILGNGSLVVDYYYTRNSYNLTWNLGGGTTTTAGTGIESGVSVNTTSSVKYGTSLTAPTVTKTGYGFSAWSPAKAATMPAEATSYTATWSATNYTITYNLNSGTNPGGAPTGFTIESSEITLPTPTRAGYRFDGWYANVGLTGDVQTTIPAGSTGNKTYWAKWTAKTDTYKTALHTGASGWTSYASGVTQSGAGYTIPAPSSVTKGVGSTCEDLHYHFAGWVADDYKGSPSGHIITATGTTDATGTTYWAVWEKEAAGGGGTSSITITRSTTGITATGYDSGAERTWTQSEIDFGGHYIMTNNKNTPSGASASQYIVMQKSNGTLYNTEELPGAITEVEVIQYSELACNVYCGDERLMASDNESTGQTPSGTLITKPDDATTMTWTISASNNYRFFALKAYTSSSSGTNYITSVKVTYSTITYEDPKAVCEACVATPSISGVSLTGSSFSTTSVPVQATGASAGDNCSLASYGFYWGTSASPTTNNTASDNLSTGTFSATLTGTFTIGTTYYYRAYATNEAPNTGYSSDATFTLHNVTFNMHSHGGDAPAAQVVPEGGKATNPGNPSEVGYTFDGWWANSTYTGSAWDFSTNTVGSGDLVLHAKWTEKPKYTITLNAGNGTVTADGWTAGDAPTWTKTQANGDEEITFPAANPGCAGWVFKGWKQGSAADDQGSFTPDKTTGATLTPTSNVTYYAVYRQSTPSGTTYTKITDEAELTTGDYLIVGYPGSSYYYAMGNSITSGHMTETSSTNATSWSNPSDGYVWTIIKAGDKVGFYNANASKYLTIVDGAWVLDATDGQKFSYSFNSTTKAWTFTSPSGKQMIYNSYFYTGDAQSSAIYLYKRGNTESGNYYTSPDCSSLTVTGVSDPVGAATVHLSSTTAKDGDVIWVTYTLNRGYTFDSWSKSGTGASLSSTSAEFTKLTVGSTAPTVTANCDALTSYTLNYHDGDGNHTMTVYEGENILSILPEPSESCDDDSPDFVGWSTSEIRVKTNTKPTYVSSSAVINSTTAASTYYAVYADAGASGDYTSTFDFQVSSGPGSPWSDASHGGASWAYSGVTFATTASCGMPNSSTLSVTLPTGSIAKSFTINGTSNSWSTSNISIAVTGEGIDGNITTFNNKGYSYNFTASNNDALEYTFTATNTSSKVAYIANIAFSYTIDAYSGFITTCCENPELAFDGEYNYQTLVRQDIHGAHGGNGSATVEQGKATLVLDYVTESDGTCTVEVKKLTGGDNRSTAAAGSSCANHTGIAINESTKKVTFDVWTYAGSYPTANGQGTYRIKITQEATSTYCAAVTYYFVDVILRDKFVDAVNGNTTINVDGQSKSTTDFYKTPTEASLDGDKNDDCHETTRRFLGWVREDNMDTWYGSSSDRTRDLDDKKDDAALVAPNADIITSGSTWYAIWGIEE